MSSHDDTHVTWRALPVGGLELEVDDTGIVRSLSLAARRELGEAFSVGKALLPPLGPVARAVAASGRPDAVETHIDERWFLFLLAKKGDGLVEVIARDITEGREAQSKLAASASRLGALVDNLGDGILVETTDRRVAMLNQSFCDMFGINAAPTELVGADCEAAAKASAQIFLDPVGFLSRIDAILELGEGVGNERIMLEDGRTFVRDFVPIGRFGNLWRYRDVTDRVAEERRYGAVLDAALDGVITIDEQGEVIDLNPAAIKIFGYSREEALGKPMGDLMVPEEMRAAHEAGVRRFRETRKPKILGQRLELTATRKNGETFPVELTVTHVGSARRGVFVGFVRDITDRVEAEMRLERARSEAEAANSAKSDFLAVMSHEIRTPMNVILGMSELLGDAGLGQDQAELVERIRVNAESLLHILNDVLDISAVEAGHFRLLEDAFDVRSVLERVHRGLVGRAEQRGLSLVMDVGPRVPTSVVGDPNRLRQILVNLIGNGIKFTERGGVTLRVKARGEGERVWLELDVIDTGVGIAPDQLEAVFERFFQTDNSTRRVHGGTGLGLAITKRLVERMGGEITLQSKVGHGSVFRVKIPFALAAGETATVGNAESLAPPSEGVRVLLVEDNEDNQLYAERVLAAAGCETTIASSGEEGLRRFVEERFDLILADIEMPGMDGMEMAAAMRAAEVQERQGRTPIVALTAHAVSGFRELCLEAGMDDYLTKPIRKKQLAEMVHRFARGEVETAAPSEPPREVGDRVVRVVIDADIADLVPRYLGSRRADLERLDEWLRAGDFAAIRGAGHNMKGSGEAYGFDEVTRIGSLLERAGRDEDAPAIAELRERLARYLAAVRWTVDE